MFIRIISAILSAIMLLFNFTPAIENTTDDFEIAVEETAYADLQTLNTAVEEANTLISIMTGYFDESVWADLSALLVEAEAYNDETISEYQNDIDTLAKSIANKTAELYNLPANQDELKSAIATAEAYQPDLYTGESWSKVVDALMLAYNVPDDATMTLQPTINQYVLGITEALASLKAGADYTLLQTIYISYEALVAKKHIYTESSWASLQAVVDEIDWSLDATGDNQYLVDAYTIKLINAMNLLEYTTFDITFHHNNDDEDLILCIIYGEETAGYIPSNPTKSGYTFVGWYDDEALTIKHTFGKMEDKNIDVYAKWEKNPPTAQLNVSVLSGYGYISVDGADEFYIGGTHTKSYTQNTLCTIRTQPNGSNQFMFWFDTRNRIISTDPTYTVAILNDLSIKALYSSVIDNHYRVVFVDRNNVILSTSYVKSGASATAPDMKYKYYSGYVFDSWDQDFSSVNSHMIIRANYVLKQEEYKVTAVGGTIANKSLDDMYQYDTHLTITPDKLINDEGESFVGWSDDGGFSIISTEKEYDFYVCRNVTITAVYSDENVKSEPKVSISSKVVNNYRVSFTTERNIPEGYTFVEAGILFTKNETIAESGLLKIDNASDNSEINQGRTVLQSNDGQYTVVFVSSEAVDFFAVGYLVYLDKLGNIQITYTDVAVASVV